MDSTTPYWTEEKHVQFLNTMEASFVRALLESKINSASNYNLNRHVPDTSESTLDLKPHHCRRTRRHHAPSARRSRRRSSQPCNSSQDQVVPQVENEREGAACNGDDDKRAEN